VQNLLCYENKMSVIAAMKTSQGVNPKVAGMLTQLSLRCCTGTPSATLSSTLLVQYVRSIQESYAKQNGLPLQNLM
jgi:hypothetical protein